MAYPAYVRAKARALRRERQLSINQIAEQLAHPKTTIYSWVSDIPLNRARRENNVAGNRAIRRKYRLLREEAFLQGRREFAYLASDPTFRDFVCLYIAEGAKRNRNAVRICNSDPRLIVLADRWIKAFASNAIRYSVQYHADQDLDALRRFWATTLDVDAEEIRVQRKSNSGKLGGRNWRSVHGVLTIDTSDTRFRARLQGWIDRVQDSWLHSADTGRSAAW